MKRWLLLLVLTPSVHAGVYEECNFVLPWARQAVHIARRVELPADRWIITEEGFEPEEYAAIMRIKHEAYHDIAALQRRVGAACAAKEDV